MFLTLSLILSLINLFLLVLIYKDIIEINSNDNFYKESTLLLLVLGIIPVLNIFIIAIQILILIYKRKIIVKKFKMPWTSIWK